MAAKKTTTIRTSKKPSDIQIPDRQFFRIGDVAELLGVKPYVLRYWETEFPTVAPQKSASNQRVYRRTDVETLVRIRRLLYEEKYSIEGARKRIARPGLRTEKMQVLRELTRELEELAQTPISKLFHL
jgi:DNA-binding transcriptional MerR regulator